MSTLNFRAPRIFVSSAHTTNDMIVASHHQPVWLQMTAPTIPTMMARTAMTMKTFVM